MVENCVICGKPVDSKEDCYYCVRYGCDNMPFYCGDCGLKHILEIRCPRHFLKSHREDVARYKKEVSK